MKEKLDYLKEYYKNYFPFNDIFAWLGVGKSETEMLRREISYIIPSRDFSGEDFVIRNCSYGSA